MPINPYFNNYTHAGQQSLLESLIIEAIQIYGFNMIYLPKTNASLDAIFRESDIDIFESHFTVETYLKSTEGFAGDGKFMTINLGFEIRDQATFTVAQSVFKTITSMTRPREGDLMYFPLDKKCYEIKYVDHQSIFYQLGKLNTWDLTVELLEYNGQIFRTGISDIDAIQLLNTLDGTDVTIPENWNDQSPEFQNDTPDIVDFSDQDPFSLGNNF